MFFASIRIESIAFFNIKSYFTSPEIDFETVSTLIVARTEVKSTLFTCCAKEEKPNNRKKRNLITFLNLQSDQVLYFCWILLHYIANLQKMFKN